MKQLFLVFIGGGTGSIARYLIGKYISYTVFGIPIGTLTANSLGCFFIGVIMGLALKNNILSQHAVLLMATGFCGGFTTFSTFAYENQMLLKSGNLTPFFIYTLISITIGLLFVFLGLYLTK